MHGASDPTGGEPESDPLKVEDMAATVKLVEDTGARIVAREADVRDRSALKTAVFDPSYTLLPNSDSELSNIFELLCFIDDCTRYLPKSARKLFSRFVATSSSPAPWFRHYIAF